METFIPRAMRSGGAVLISSNAEDIIAINRRSVATKNGIRIMELSSLSDLVPMETAEDIRVELLKNNVKVKQLTNLKKFENWTIVDEFVRNCLTVRHVAEDIFSINAEVLLFDDVVALYQTEPVVSVVIIENEIFATHQRALFDAFWKAADPVQLNPDGSTVLVLPLNADSGRSK